MARQGFPRMGMSACFGEPLFSILSLVFQYMNLIKVNMLQLEIEYVYRNILKFLDRKFRIFLSYRKNTFLCIKMMQRWKKRRKWYILITISKEYVCFVHKCILWTDIYGILTLIHFYMKYL